MIIKRRKAFLADYLKDKLCGWIQIDTFPCTSKGQNQL